LRVRVRHTDHRYHRPLVPLDWLILSQIGKSSTNHRYHRPLIRKNSPVNGDGRLSHRPSIPPATDTNLTQNLFRMLNKISQSSVTPTIETTGHCYNKWRNNSPLNARCHTDRRYHRPLIPEIDSIADTAAGHTDRRYHRPLLHMH